MMQQILIHFRTVDRVHELGVLLIGDDRGDEDNAEKEQ